LSQVRIPRKKRSGGEMSRCGKERRRRRGSGEECGIERKCKDGDYL